MKWGDIRLGRKILIGIGSALIMLVAVSFLAVSGIGGIVKGGMEVAGGNKLRGELLQREVDHLKWAQSVGRYVHDETKELKVQLDPAQCGLGKWYYGEGRKNAESLLAGLREPLSAVEEPHRRLHETAGRILQLHSEGRETEARTVYEQETMLHLETVQGLLKKVADLSKEHILSEDVMLTQAQRARSRLLLVSVAAIGLGIFLGIVITRAIVRPVQQGLAFAKNIASGDLRNTLQIAQKDEMGQLADALNDMVRRLEDVAARVTGAADTVAFGSQELSGNAGVLSQRATEQAASTKEASSSVEQMNATIRQNADNALQTEKIALMSAANA